MSLPWTEKYRPHHIDQIQSHHELIKLLNTKSKIYNLPHILLHGPPGTGKCLDPFCKVLMSNNETIYAKDIRAGDKIMGDDFNTRTILSIVGGVDKMYKIKQDIGEDYIVNSVHVLSLILVNGTRPFIKYDIPLNEYLQLSLSVRDKLYGYKNLPNGQTVLTKILVCYSHIGSYCGFEIDGNGRFLLRDFTVTHNTSTALALCRDIFGKRLQSRVLELNASDDRGIGIVRTRIVNFAKLAVAKDAECPPYKIIILDEVDAMTVDAQSALRKIIEEFSSVTRFCFTCNYINKIIEPILSRCAVFRFCAIPVDIISRNLNNIVINEGLEVTQETIDFIAKFCAGDMRRAICYLQNLKYFKKERISLENILYLTAHTDTQTNTILGELIQEGLEEKLSNNYSSKVLLFVDTIKRNGYVTMIIVEMINTIIITHTKINDRKKAQILKFISSCCCSLGDEFLLLLSIFARIVQILRNSS